MRKNNLNKKIFIFFVIFGILFFQKPQKVTASIDYEPWNTVVNAVSAALEKVSNFAEVSLTTKETILDGLLYGIMNIAKNSMITSTVNWINTGFEGGPAFITDYQGYLGEVADAVIGDYIYGTKLNWLCSPFNASVRLALAQQFSGKWSPRCTLSQISKNLDNAVNDMNNQWDWNSWNSMSQSSGNNAYGAYIDSSIRISADLDAKKQEKLDKLNWGSGFLSWEKCHYEGPDDDVDGLPDNQVCEDVTPGKVLGDALMENGINMGGKALIEADEINEIVGALAGQLVKKVVGPEGLLGVSRGSGGNSSYINQMSYEQWDQSGVVAKTRESINMDIGNENSYIKPKQDIVDMFRDAKLRLNILQQCYIKKGQEAEQNTPPKTLWNSQGNSINLGLANAEIQIASSTISQYITPRESSALKAISDAENIIKRLELIKVDISGAKNVTELSLLIEEYQRLQSNQQFHSVADVVYAEDERNRIRSSVNNQMSQIEYETMQKINVCESYTLKNQPSSD